ncbi:MAG: ketosteroid isomerase-like protein [Flavobacteriales bacterium]|jgi:ketosteroid isomerase-like protein
MKKVLLTAIVILGFTTVSMAQSSSKECDKLIASHKQTEANIKMYVSTWDHIFNNGGDMEYVNEKYFDKNVRLKNQKEEVTSTGIAGFKEHFNVYHTMFSDIKFTFVDVWGQGDNLVKHWNFKGIARTSGKLMNLSGVTLVKMKDGKIIEEQDFDDNLWFMQQLGAIAMDK